MLQSSRRQGVARFFLLVLLAIPLACTPKKQNARTTEPAQQAENQAGGQSLAGGQTLARIRQRGALKVGLSSFNPWAMQDAKGNWIGFEIDVAKKFARDAEIELELVPTAWSGIIPALLTGKFDIIIGGMTVTPERAEQVTFSAPYEYAKIVLLLNRSVAVSSADQLNDAKYRLVGRAGSTPFVLTRRLFPKAQLKSFDDDGLSMQDLLNGQADAFLTTSIEAAIQVEKYPQTIHIPEWGREMNKENIAFGLPKKVETTWLTYVNQWIQDNWDNGFLEEKSRYWFESRNWTADYQLAE